MQNLSVEEIQARIFTRTSDLPNGVERLPIKEIHFNKSPIVATTKLCDDKSAKRLLINKALCEKNWQKLVTLDIADKIQAVFGGNLFQARKDPEQMLYDGFIPGKDKTLMQDVRQASLNELKNREFRFQDKRLNEIFLRYKARNFPSSLSDEEKLIWLDIRQKRLSDGDENILSKADFLESLKRMASKNDLMESHKHILADLHDYANTHT